MFKKGDMVVCINNDQRRGLLELGKVYEVVGYYHDELKLKGFYDTFFPHRFRLAKKIRPLP